MLVVCSFVISFCLAIGNKWFCLPYFTSSFTLDWFCMRCFHSVRNQFSYQLNSDLILKILNFVRSQCKNSCCPFNVHFYSKEKKTNFNVVRDPCAKRREGTNRLSATNNRLSTTWNANVQWLQFFKAAYFSSNVYCVNKLEKISISTQCRNLPNVGQHFAVISLKFSSLRSWISLIKLYYYTEEVRWLWWC